MVVTRRFLVLVALLLWQGGAIFYAAVVVPAGLRVLERNQTVVTLHVTPSQLLLGVVALLALLVDWAATRDPVRWRKRLRGGLWLALAAAHAGLGGLYASLAAKFDPRTLAVAEPAAFTGEHGLYVAVAAVQSACALAYLGLSLAAWRCADRGAA